MGEKEGTAPSRTKSKKIKTQLERTRKAQATADARVRSLFVTTMAAAPPAAGATPGTPYKTTTTTTMAAHSITTYAEHYAALPNNLQGRYDLLLAPYDPASGRLHQKFLHCLLSMLDASSKALTPPWRCWAHSQQGTLALSPSSAARWYRSQQPTYIGTSGGGGGGGRSSQTPRKWSVRCCSIGFEQPSLREVARQPPPPLCSPRPSSSGG